MKSDTPVTLAVAVYDNREAAVEDYHNVRNAKTDGEYDHIAVAVLTKDENGKVQVERHDSTAKHLAWAGGLLGGAAVLLAPAAVPIVFATSVGAGGGVTAAGLAATGGIVGHFWHNIPKEKVREMSDLLEDGESALIIVAVNKLGSDISPLIPRATRSIIDDTTKADLEAVYEEAVKQVEAAPAADS
jgi:uncharacterized membrane protein